MHSYVIMCVIITSDMASSLGKLKFTCLMLFDLYALPKSTIAI